MYYFDGFSAIPKLIFFCQLCQKLIFYSDVVGQRANCILRGAKNFARQTSELYFLNL